MHAGSRACRGCGACYATTQDVCSAALGVVSVHNCFPGEAFALRLYILVPLLVPSRCFVVLIRDLHVACSTSTHSGYRCWRSITRT
jgi:hypothetical protein